MLPSLPDIRTLLTGGGDSRIALGPQGTNKYGCYPTPQPNILSYSSCTASTISPAGFAAAGQLYLRLKNSADIKTYEQELNRIRNELSALCGLASPAGAEIIFSPSGTDLHHFAARLLSQRHTPLFTIMPDASETGSFVPGALHGDGNEIAALQSRTDDGSLRSAELIDSEAETLAIHAINKGRHVLLILTDVSKTGLTFPSPACALALKQRFADRLDVLVDGCQFRLCNATLRAYLKQEFLLAVTGSKFVTGPAFSAALLVPEAMARRFPSAHDAANFGLLLRWEAALAELRAFHALPETAIYAFIERFADAVQNRLADDPAFEPLAVGEINRKPLIAEKTWDQCPTIFPFLLRRPQSGALLNKAEAAVIYERMKAGRCFVGQPVACGALRLCLDMRLIARGDDSVITDAMRVLDMTTGLAAL